MFYLEYSDPREASNLAEFLPLGIRMDVKVSTDFENEYNDESGLKIQKWK